MGDLVEPGEEEEKPVVGGLELGEEEGGYVAVVV